ncbi:hypothetical protein [Actinoplanes sp. NPDC049265]
MPIYLRNGGMVLIGGMHTGAIGETGEMFGEAWAMLQDQLGIALS